MAQQLLNTMLGQCRQALLGNKTKTIINTPVAAKIAENADYRKKSRSIARKVVASFKIDSLSSGQRSQKGQ